MDKLPQHGRINCTKCFADAPVEFDQTKRTESEWRITANPLAWGNPNSEIVVLGFSKGPTQAGALANTPHDEIAYKGGRANVAKILFHIGVLQSSSESEARLSLDNAIADRSGRFHFGSLIRCTVERHEKKTSTWTGTGGGMLDKFVSTDFGKSVAGNCSTRFLSRLPTQTRLIVMFGLGTKLNYVQESFKLYQAARGGEWSRLSEVAYSDGHVVVVHVEHFKSRGALIPNWMGEKNHQRGRYGKMAQDAVKRAIH